MALKRRDVIAAGVDIAAKEGAEGLGVFSVARRLGIKAPSLYNHVTGNADLHHSVALEGYKMLADSLRANPTQLGRNPEKALRSLSRTFRKFALENPKLYEFCTAAQLDPSEAECIATIARVLEPFESALEGLGYRRAAAGHALRGLRAALHGFVTLELSGQFSQSPGANRSFELLLDRLVVGPANEESE